MCQGASTDGSCESLAPYIFISPKSQTGDWWDWQSTDIDSDPHGEFGDLRHAQMGRRLSPPYLRSFSGKCDRRSCPTAYATRAILDLIVGRGIEPTLTLQDEDMGMISSIADRSSATSLPGPVHSKRMPYAVRRMPYTVCRIALDAPRDPIRTRRGGTAYAPQCPQYVTA